MYGVDDEDCGEFEVSMSMLFDGNHSKSWLEHEVITKDGETAVVSILRIDDIGGSAISGHVLWPTATALTDHFSKKWGDFDYFRHCKRMFELGCGAGLIGLGCATIGGEDLEMVVCSDYDASLFPALEKSVTKTRVCCSSVAPMETRTFDWTKPAYDSVVRQHSFDVVFGGDLIYAKECVADIFKSASLLLKDNGVFILSSSFINYPELVERYRAQNGFNRIHSERLNADTESPCLVEHFQLQMECPLNTGGQMVIQSQAIERHDWWTQVFLCLPPSDLIQFAFVCKSFHRVLALDTVARHIVVSRISERWPYLSVAEMDNLETLRESYRARNILETSWLPRVWTTEYRGSFEVGKYSRWVVPFIDPSFIHNIPTIIRLLYCLGPKAYLTYDGADKHQYDPLNSTRSGESPGWNIGGLNMSAENLSKEFKLGYGAYTAMIICYCLCFHRPYAADIEAGRFVPSLKLDEISRFLSRFKNLWSHEAILRVEEYLKAVADDPSDRKSFEICHIVLQASGLLRHDSSEIEADMSRALNFVEDTKVLMFLTSKYRGSGDPLRSVFWDIDGIVCRGISSLSTEHFETWETSSDKRVRVGDEQISSRQYPPLFNLFKLGWHCECKLSWADAYANFEQTISETSNDHKK